jgi:hypothetical protein
LRDVAGSRTSRSNTPLDFCFRLVPRLACLCRRLLHPKGKKRATFLSSLREDNGDRVLAKDNPTGRRILKEFQAERNDCRSQ